MTGESQSGCNHRIGEIRELAHFLWQQVDVLFVSSLRSAVQFYHSQGLRVQVSVILTHMVLNSDLAKYIVFEHKNIMYSSPELLL